MKLDNFTKSYLKFQLNQLKKTNVSKDAINLLEIILDENKTDYDIQTEVSKLLALIEKLNDSIEKTTLIFAVGLCYDTFDLSPECLKYAFKMFEWASKLGYPSAFECLGRYYEQGIGGVEKDLKSALHYFEVGAKLGNAKAMNALGNWYSEGIFVQKDIQRGMLFYESAALQDLPEAAHNLGHHYMDGIGVAKDLKKAVMYLTKAAEQGDDAAYNNLGVCFEKGGEDLVQDLKKAVECYRLAADLGNVEAQYTLGESYLCGDRGLEEDFEQAFKYYSLAAQQGHSRSQFRVGGCYYKAFGVERDFKKAAEWFSKAAKQKHARALYFLAWSYFNGEGVPKDSKRFLELLTEAAKQGEKDAQADLGDIYHNGRHGVKIDRKKALDFFVTSALKQSKKGLCYVGGSYADGNLVEQNLTRALLLWRKCVEMGHEAANDLLLSLIDENPEKIDKDFRETDLDKLLDLCTKKEDYSTLGFCHQFGIGTPVQLSRAVQSYNDAIKHNLPCFLDLMSCFQNMETFSVEDTKTLHEYCEELTQFEREHGSTKIKKTPSEPETELATKSEPERRRVYIDKLICCALVRENGYFNSCRDIHKAAKLFNDAASLRRTVEDEASETKALVSSSNSQSLEAKIDTNMTPLADWISDRCEKYKPLVAFSTAFSSIFSKIVLDACGESYYPGTIDRLCIEYAFQLDDEEPYNADNEYIENEQSKTLKSSVS